MPTLRISKFSNREIEKIPVPEKGVTYVYPDEKRPKLGVTITRAGTRKFHVKVNRKGYYERISIPEGDLRVMTVSEARKKMPEVIAEAMKGNTPNEKRKKVQAKKEAEKRESMTVYELLKSYIEYRKDDPDKPLKPRTIEDYNQKIKWEFEETDLVSDITPESVEKLMRERGKKCYSALRILKAMIGYAQKKLDYKGDNPVPETLQPYARKKSYLKEAYLEDWFKALDNLDGDRKEYLLFLLLTGIRSDSEVGKLTWDKVDFKSESFTLTDTKNGTDIELPIPSYLVPMLKDRKKKKGKVFACSMKDYRTAYEQVSDEIGLHVTRHDLRRTFMTIGESIDVSYLTVKRLANHKTQESDVTAGYIVMSLERLRKASKLIEAEILRLGKVML